MDFRRGRFRFVSNSRKTAGLKSLQLRELLRGKGRLHVRKRPGKNDCQLGFGTGRLLRVLAREVIVKFPADDLVQ